MGERLLRATSMFVLVLWFLQKGAFASYLLSTIVRAIHGLRALIQNISIQNDNDDGRKMTIANNSGVSNDSDSDDDGILSSRKSGPVSNAFE